MTTDTEPLVRTIKERCKACYTCVRGCPAKAIRISGGQAEVIRERCIGCANCALMCSRAAKETRSSTANVKALLSGPAPVAACPAVVSCVEKYHPGLVKNLAPIVSPMTASVRIVRATYGEDVKTVFIGPCVAKKDEAYRHREDIEEAITFRELRDLFAAAGVDRSTALDAHFDPPHPGKGVLYPLGGGLLNFARKNKPFFRRTDLASLVNSYFKAVPLPASVTLKEEPAGEELAAEMDPDQVIQALSNLVTNALEAMPGGGTLTARTFLEEGSAAFSVSDSGCGIKPENFKKIFEPFFTTKQIGKGTGLGLAVSYGIIKAHRGNIAVESNSDPAKGPTGTTFTVKLPRVAREAGAVKLKAGERAK